MKKLIATALLALSCHAFAGDPLVDMWILNHQGDSQPGYEVPSPFKNPRVRNYFGSAGQKVDPVLAAEIDRRISNAGGTHTSKSMHATVFNGGEFSGKTLAQAIQAIMDGGATPVKRGSALDKDGRDAAFFESKHQPNAPLEQPPEPAKNQIEEREKTRTAQEQAVRIWPELAISGSKLNLKFVDEVSRIRRENPSFFEDPDWPLKVAKWASDQVKADDTPRP